MNKTKKQTKAVLLTEQDLFSNYKYLPFQTNDCIRLFPVVKALNLRNKDVKAVMSQANLAFKENAMDRAFELYS